jgi:hypothetical protein
VSASVRYGFSIERIGPGTAIALREGKRDPDPPRPAGNVPRIARLVALAHRFAAELRSATAASMAELAAQRGITRARMTQIMNLLLLAPDIQEELLFLPPTVRGCDQVTLRTMGYVCATPIWPEQRTRWYQIKEA